MMQTIDIHADPAIGPLFDVGPRRHKRLRPTPLLPATAAIRSAGGRSIPERPVGDISLSGLSLRLGFWQGRRVAVGDVVTVVLDLAGRRYALNARTMHLSRNRESLLGDWLCGLQFVEDRTFRAYWTILRDYLLQIVTEPS